MTYLAVLDQGPLQCAEAHADVHLSPSLTRCAQLLSTAAQEVVPSEIRLEPNAKGIKEFRFNEMVLLPPIKDAWVRPWIDWIKEEYQRSWWLVSQSWFFDRELRTRFGQHLPQHPDAVRLNVWIQQGLTRVFAKTGKRVENFPLVLPAGARFDQALSSIENYRKYYAGLQQSHRMKWSGRNKPEFLGGPKVPKMKSICDLCQSDAGTACSVAGCPLADNTLPF